MMVLSYEESFMVYTNILPYARFIHKYQKLYIRPQMLRRDGKGPSLTIEKNILEFSFYLYPMSGPPT